MEDLLQLWAFQQPPQKLLNLSPLQPLVVGVVTLLESSGERRRGGDTVEKQACTDTPITYHGQEGRCPPFHR